MDTIVGVDPSVQKTGVCVWTEKGYAQNLIDTRPKKGVAKLGDPGRLRFICDRVQQTVSLAIHSDGWHAGAKITLAIEGHAGQRGHGMINIALHWMIRDRLAIWFSEVSTLVVAPMRLKKFICNVGNAEKGTVGAAVVRHWGSIIGPDAQEDIMDAVALCQLGRCYLGMDGDWTQYQKDVVASCGALELDSESIRMAMER